MLVISSVNVDVQEAALVEVCAVTARFAPFPPNPFAQVDRRGFKVLAFCNERDSVDEKHQWREVGSPSRQSVVKASALACVTQEELTGFAQVRFSFNNLVHTLDEARQQLATLHAELKSGLTQARQTTHQPAMEMAGKDAVSKKHHIK